MPLLILKLYFAARRQDDGRRELHEFILIYIMLPPSDLITFLSQRSFRPPASLLLGPRNFHLLPLPVLADRQKDLEFALASQYQPSSAGPSRFQKQQTG